MMIFRPAPLCDQYALEAFPRSQRWADTRKSYRAGGPPSRIRLGYISAATESRRAGNRALAARYRLSLAVPSAELAQTIYEVPAYTAAAAPLPGDEAIWRRRRIGQFRR